MQPLVTAEAQRENFTNEGGVDGRTRFLRNVGGLWLLQESLRHWQGQGLDLDFESLLTEAEMLGPGGATVDVDDERFIAPGDMPARIQDAAARSGQNPPETPAAVTRCILDSLATAYARTVTRAAELAGRDLRVIHVVGGGSQNAVLCQLTADLSGLPVTSGPVEATAFGNVAIQARAHGAGPVALEHIRASLRESLQIRTFVPMGRSSAAAPVEVTPGLNQ
jgi:rhamnulokinase